MKKNKLPELLWTCVALSASLAAHGATLGTPSGTVVLGQPLQMWVPLDGDGDSPIAPGCVSAAVQSGDVMLPNNQVRVQLITRQAAGQWLVRVMTTSPVEEPVLQLAVSVGCSGKLSRQYVLLADPPGASTSAPLVAAPALVAADADGVVQSLEPAPAEASPRMRGSAAAEHAQPRSVKKRPAARQAFRHGPARPRLQLDAMEPTVAMVAQAAASGAASAPSIPASSALSARVTRAASAAEAASAAAANDAALLALRRSGDAMRQANQELRERLEATERRYRWLLLGLGGVILAMGVGGVLLWRRQRMLLQSRPWWSDDAPAGAASSRRAALDEHEIKGPEEAAAPVPAPVPAQSPTPAASGPAPTLEIPSGWGRDEPVLLPDTILEAGNVDLEATAPIPPLKPNVTMTFSPANVPREVSVEELLDLEQQADFFIALGQEDAAVEVLMSHLRGTGGQSPLPYTKLLEIYRRQGDRDAYERMRGRFNRRFNAYAPDWEIGPLHGRVLEDYPAAVREVQAVWGSPLDAMAVLEGMLFRRDESRELFDLPAYRDLLMLYAIARDLWQAAGGQNDQVDLLLPILDGSATGASVSAKPDATHLDLDLLPVPAKGATPPAV